MKKLFFGLMIAILLIFNSCTDQDPITATPKLLSVQKDGCFTSKNGTTSPDTLYCEVINDTLLLHVTINKNCSSQPLDSVALDQGVFNIYLKDQFEPDAYCICDYQYTFKFANWNLIQHFNVLYKDFGTTSYNNWNSITYP
jgi:hypothetical protein